MASFEDVKEAIRASQPVFYSRGGEVNVRCPFCGDSRNDPRSAHLYLNEEWPHPFNCFRCQQRGRHITPELVLALDAATREASVYARQVAKEYRRRGPAGAKEISGRRGKRLVLPRPDRRDEFDAFTLGYVEGRLGGTLEDWELERYKVVIGLERFLRANGIDEHTLGWKQDEFERLNSDCVGFLCSDESYIIFRTTDPEWGKNPKEKRFTNYQVWPEWEGSKLFTTRQDLDALAPSYEVVITESIMNLIQVERMFYPDRRGKPDFLGVAVCGTSYGAALKKVIEMGLFPLHVHIYMDDEPRMVDRIRKALQESPFFSTPNFRVDVWRNDVPNEKDFGITPDRIRRVKVRL